MRLRSILRMPSETFLEFALLSIFFGIAIIPRAVRADGVMIARERVGVATNLVSSPKQEALLMVGEGEVTVVLRTHFERGPEELAWIVPVPNVPRAIGARDDSLFTELEAATAPEFYSYHAARRGFGCAANAVREPMSSLVTHEASGTAGVFQFEVLAATSARDLLAWLGDHGYRAQNSLESALTPYVRARYHFLAMRVRPEVIDRPTLAPHPICYTYFTDSLTFPLMISKPSAAPQNEVLLYVLGRVRYGCENWKNASHDQMVVRRSAGTPSGTNYESLILAAGADHTFVTEFGGDLDNVVQRPLLQRLLGHEARSELPAREAGPVSEYRYLTRFRALLAPTAMDRDVCLVPVATLPDVHNVHFLGAIQTDSPPAFAMLSVAGGLSGLALCGGKGRRVSGSKRMLLGIAALVGAWGVSTL